MASKHAETVKESEKRMRIIQQERQAVFQDAFQNDLKYFKEVGKIPSKFSLFKLRSDKKKLFSIWIYLIIFFHIEIENKTIQQSLSLEEVVLDNEFEQQALDKFLED